MGSTAILSKYIRTMIRSLRTLTGILCLVALPFAAAAQSVLPSSFAGWTASAPSTAILPGGLDQILGANAGAFKEYVVKGIEQRPYSTGDRSRVHYNLPAARSEFGLRGLHIFAERFDDACKSRLVCQRLT